MPADFMRTLRSLQADGSRWTILGLAVAALVACGWGLWFVGSEVFLYEVTRDARLEVNRAVYRVAAPMTGRIVSYNLLLGEDVEAGAVMVELDSEPQRLQLEEVSARRQALVSEIAPLKMELAAAAQALVDQDAAAEAEMKEAQADLRKARIALSLANDKAERFRLAHEKKGVGTLEAKQAQNEAEQQESVVESREHRLRYIEMDYKSRANQVRTLIEEIKHDIAEIEGRISTAEATAKRLGHEVERRQIRAPVSGRIGEVSAIRIGAVAAEGEILSTIVTPGDLRIVAEYAPAAAVGRIKPGQAARLRLDGFPWIQYGSVLASVTTVGDEPREGRIRVELVNDQETPFRVPLIHGMTGTVEIEVEKISPLRLILRAIGKRLGALVKEHDPLQAGSQVTENQS